MEDQSKTKNKHQMITFKIKEVNKSIKNNRKKSKIESDKVQKSISKFHLKTKKQNTTLHLSLYLVAFLFEFHFFLSLISL